MLFIVTDFLFIKIFMSKLILTTRFYIILCFSIVLVFLALTVSSSLTNRPQVDEGLFASPAFNLATQGFFGTTVLETEQSPLTRIEERTYWVMPLFLLNVAAAFKTFGMSVLTMRLVSVFWGLALLGAWYFIVLKLSGNRNIALLSLLLIAGNYTITDTSSLGRMDIMCAALGFSALAIYLWRRETDLTSAVLLGQCFVVLSGLTHPNGIFAFFGLLFLIVYLDFRRLNLKIVAVALLPYLIGGTAFGIWVLQDVEAFKAQFIDNALMGGRMSGANSPLSGIIREFTEKYPHAYGLGATSGGHSGPIYLKSLIILSYIAGVFGVIFTKSLRQNRNYFILLVLTGIYFVLMSLIDGQKQTPYLVHIVPFYCALLAVWLQWIWQKNTIPRPLIIGAVAALMLLQIGGMAMRIKQNTYGNYYVPLTHFLQENVAENDLMMCGSDIAFASGFPKNYLVDGRYGYYTGKRPKFLIYDSSTENSWRGAKETAPQLYEHLPRLLQDYEIVYENAAYKVYQRR